MAARNLMRWDEGTYANLLPGVLYDLGEAVDRVKIDYPFDDPHFTRLISFIYKVSRGHQDSTKADCQG